MKSRTSFLSAFVACTLFANLPVSADNMASIAITPATGEVTLVPRWAIGGELAGFHFMAQDLSLGGGANQFYSIKGTAIPDGGDIAAFTRYIAGSGAATNHEDIGSKLTPLSYSALTSADPDVGYGSVNFYFIHHKTTGDYFSVIVPGSATASAVTDLKPMSGPGGPATLGESGYFGLTFAAANLGHGLERFYYLRTDPVNGYTHFGTLAPALLGTSADLFDLGMGGFTALAFTGSDVGYGTDKMYYTRLDPLTGFTILGTLHPVTGRVSDIANLGSVFSTLTFVPGDVGYGTGQFYTTGAVNATWQSVSFAAIDDREISAGSFTVAPTASSGLPIVLTVVPGSTGAASISAPVGGVFTVTPTAPGLITLQATQAGQLMPTPFAFNMLRQSFTATGTVLLGITAQPAAQLAAPGTTATLAVAASGTTALTYQWRKDGVAIAGNATASTATLVLTNTQAADSGSYDVVVSNASGSIASDAAVLTVASVSRIVNLSARALSDSGDGAMIVGFVVSGDGKDILLRGIGPTLGTFDVPNTMVDPMLTLHGLNGAVTTNDNWQVSSSGQPEGAAKAAAAQRLGAFPLPVGSKDAALLTTVDQGAHTTSLRGLNGATGVALTEVYDNDGSFDSVLINISLRVNVSAGEGTPVLGFVIEGNTSKTVLIRGVGPTLEDFAVTNVLADPEVTVFSGNTEIANNDDWATGTTPSAQLVTAAAQVGAFALQTASADAALLLTLAPGIYTVHLTGVGNTTGVGLIEIYDTQ